MKCPQCAMATRKFGFTKVRTQRFRCDYCCKTFTEEKQAPLGAMRLEMGKAEMVLKMLLEGCSVRSVSRLTGVDKGTILALVVHVGNNCNRMLKAKLCDLVVDDVQADEIWSFVGMKEKTRVALRYGEEFGDCYTYVAIERTTKLIVAWHMAKRCTSDTYEFSHKLHYSTTGHFGLTTDGWGAYRNAIPDTFGNRVDFAQLIKQYGPAGVEEQRRYSPAKVIGIDYTPISGQPTKYRACTSHIERSNLSLRMSSRRFTRLTNAFSKKWENHKAMLAIWFAFYNFARKHMTLKETPAMASGLENHVWTMRELITESAKF